MKSKPEQYADSNATSEFAGAHPIQAWQAFVSAISRPSVALVLHSFAFALLVALAVYELVQGPETYERFIVGLTTFQGTSKTRDFAAVAAFMAMVVTYLTIGSAIRSFCINRLGSPEILDHPLYFALFPVALAFGPLLTAGPTSVHPLVIGVSAGVLCIIFALIASLRAPEIARSVHEDAIRSAIRVSVLTPLLSLAIPFALNIATGRIGGEPVSSAPLQAGAAFGLGAFGIIAVLWWTGGLQLTSRLRRVLLFAQAPLVFLYLVLIPPTFISPEGAAPQPMPGVLLYLLVGGMMLIALVDLVRRGGDERSALSPLALGGLLLCFAVPLNYAPYLPSDDFHFGEYIYPFWAYLNFDIKPYLEYTPAHGLINYLPGLISSLLFDGSAAAYTASITIYKAALALLVFISLSGLHGVGLAWLPALFLPLVLPTSWMLVAVVFGAFTLGTRYLRSAWWVAVWLIVGTGTVLAAPAQGVALVLATIPAGLFLFYQSLKTERLLLLSGLGVLALGVLLTVYLFPIIPALISALHYILINSSINAIAYGIPWTDSISYPAYEILRMAWVVVPIIAIALLVARPALTTSAVGLLVLGAALIFPLAIFGYVMGRIDAGPTRMGAATLWMLLVALPSLLVVVQSRALLPVLVLVTIGSAALYPRSINVDPIAAASYPSASIPSLTDGPSAGLTNVGHVLADPVHFERAATIKRHLDKLLTETETFLDMTGHSADYFYTQRAMPVNLGAPYNMAHPDQQSEAVARLAAGTPPVALMDAGNLIFEGQSTALRAYELYRWAILTYRPVELDGYIYGLTPERFEAAGLGLRVSVTAANHSDVNWTNGIAVSGNTFLGENIELAQILRPGDKLTFSGSGERTILAINGRMLTVNGSLDPIRDGYPNQIQVPERISADVARQQELALLDRSFRVANLAALPISWGRSVASLGDQMQPRVQLNLANAKLNDLEVNAEGGFVPTGADPYLIFDMEAFRGASAGLLVARFHCEAGTGPSPSLQVFWASKGSPQFSETASVSFNAAPGWLIVPLDSQPRWLLAEDVHQVRIDLNNPASCSSFDFERLHLAQRANN